MDARALGPEDRSTAVICDCGLLGDCHGSAPVSRNGSVDWWCPPRFDGSRVTGRFTLAADERAAFALHHRSSTDPP